MRKAVRAVLVIVVLFYLMIVALGTYGSWTRIRFGVDPMTPSDTLVVFVHGMGGPSKSVSDLLVREFPGAHIVEPKYFSLPFSNAEPRRIAAATAEKIADLDEKHRYKDIILVGHSAGASIVRKVYVWASGYEQDRPHPEGRKAWVDRVSRVVMLAGLTRGWSINPPPENLRWWRRMVMQSGIFVAKITGTGKFIRTFERGAPFVANLRIQWIQLVREARESGQVLPMVIQILGDGDDIVSADDMRDVGVAKGFIDMPLGVQTGHAEVAQVDPSAEKDPEKRAEVEKRRTSVRIALKENPCAHPSVAKCGPSAEDPKQELVVFVRHGIRDYGGPWLQKVKEEVERQRPGTIVDWNSYDYFGMGPFLLFNARQRNVRDFVDKYTELLASYPNARFGFIGHSNGTYILSSALQRYAAIEIDRAVFVGSVAPRAYDWPARIKAKQIGRGSVTQQIKGVVNLSGGSDWVVAIFPHFFEQMAGLFRRQRDGMFDIGAAGFRGFSLRPAGVQSIEWADGGHRAGFGEDMANLPVIVAYVVHKADAVPIRNPVNDPDGVISFLSSIAWLIWILLIGGVVLLGYGVGRVSRRLNKPWAAKAGVSLYVLLILMVLRTI